MATLFQAWLSNEFHAGSHSAGKVGDDGPADGSVDGGGASTDRCAWTPVSRYSSGVLDDVDGSAAAASSSFSPSSERMTLAVLCDSRRVS